MPSHKLQLRYHAAARHTACAWFITGDRATMLDRLIAAGYRSLERIDVVPIAGDKSLHASGALLIPRELEPKSLPGAVAFGCRANRLYLPVNADLEPAVSDSGLAKLLFDDYVYVWHPAHGLIALEKENVQQATTFLSPPGLIASHPSVAEPGVALSNRILALEADTAPDLDQFFGEERQQIGSDSGNLGDLPAAPNESSSSVADQVWQGVTG
ncbi:MAG: hypothetical protein AAF497_06150, partial [Planctomycetota bacterium]